MGRQETETGGWSEVPEPAVIPLARQAKPAQAKPRIRKSSWGTRTRPLTVIARSPCDEAIQGPRAVAPGLLRCARNDGGADATIIGLRLRDSRREPLSPRLIRLATTFHVIRERRSSGARSSTARLSRV